MRLPFGLIPGEVGENPDNWENLCNISGRHGITRELITYLTNSGHPAFQSVPVELRERPPLLLPCGYPGGAHGKCSQRQ